ncbi:porin family protein [Methylocapsa polymorpha]|uniref:Porin family protein n=1 Tax=Methylocapsa polymorpha TaxID=3080828 RepID=A0ABZ0HWY4_9HYPH|nr:porin family protein [Methylocapsa sp. RX1]
MKRLLLASAGAAALAGSALAADLPAVALPPPPVIWAGPYVGGQVGYAWGEDSGDVFLAGPLGALAITPITVSSSSVTQGFLGGGHVGYNWQINRFVLGFEGQIDAATFNKTTQPLFAPPYNVTTTSPVQGAYVARLGYTFDRTLVYAVGGAEYAWVRNYYNILGSSRSFSYATLGWTFGGGLEYALDPNWSVRAEYRYTNFGSFRDGPIYYPNAYQTHGWRENQVQIGFSYRWPPVAPVAVVAKY